jgi:hypothetical protein
MTEQPVDPAPAPPLPEKGPPAVARQAPADTRMSAANAKKLREPFPKHLIGQLPKGGVMLDYVGHAAVTDRLLQVDPAWVWEPLALTPDGLPALDRAGNLWIRLTVCGVTRVGVGDGKNAKECISDAIRNAAMRFGVALDLWAKDGLRGDADTVADAQEQPPASREAAPVITNPQRKRLWAVATENTVGEDLLRQIVLDIAGVESTTEIPKDKYDLIIEAVQAQAVPF